MDPSLLQLVGGAMGLDRATFEAMEAAPHGLRASLLVLLLAGASATLGQAVVLILNRVSRARFVAALGLGGLELALEAVVWIASVWMLAGVLGAPRPSLATAARVMGLAYAPLVLGFCVFFPYLGPLLDRLLRVWVLLAAVLGTSVAFDLPPLSAAVAVGVGFLARWLLLAAFGRIAEVGTRWLRHTRGSQQAVPQPG